MKAVIVGGAPLIEEDRKALESADEILAVNHHFVAQKVSPTIIFSNANRDSIYLIRQGLEDRSVKRIILRRSIFGIKLYEYVKRHKPEIAINWYALTFPWVKKAFTRIQERGGSPFSGVLASYYLAATNQYSDIYIAGMNFYVKDVRDITVARKHKRRANIKALFELFNDNPGMFRTNDYLRGIFETVSKNGELYDSYGRPVE